MEKKRIEWVDSAKFLCMLAVMAEHAESMTGTMDKIIDPFYLNMFSFAAGYVYVHRHGFKDFLGKKVRQLLVPWFCFSLLVILSSHLFSFNAHESLGKELLQNFLQIKHSGGEMWYVAALFVAFLPFYFFIDRYERSALALRRKTALLLGVSFVLALLSLAFATFFPRDILPWTRELVPAALPWHLEYMFQAMFAMVLGYLFRRFWEPGFDRHDGPWTCLLLWAAYLAAVLVIGGPMPYYGLARYLWYYPSAFLGMAAVISLAKRIRPNRYTRCVGQNTLTYYGLHGKVESVLQAMLRHFWYEPYEELIWGGHESSALLAVALSLLVSVILMPVAWFINRYLPFMVGRKPAKGAVSKRKTDGRGGY